MLQTVIRDIAAFAPIRSATRILCAGASQDVTEGAASVARVSGRGGARNATRISVCARVPIISEEIITRRQTRYVAAQRWRVTAQQRGVALQKDSTVSVRSMRYARSVAVSVRRRYDCEIIMSASAVAGAR